MKLIPTNLYKCSKIFQNTDKMVKDWCMAAQRRTDINMILYLLCAPLGADTKMSHQ